MRRILCVACAGILLGLMSVGAVIGDRAGASAGYPDWQAGTPVVRERAGGTAPPDNCIERTVAVEGLAAGPACITEMNGWRYGLFTDWYYQYGLRTSRTVFIVGLGSDTKMYAVSGMPTSVALAGAPATDTLIYHRGNDEIRLYRDFPSSLVRTATGYTVSDRPPTVLTLPDGRAPIAGHIALSPSGEWLVADALDGIMRVNLRSLAVKVVAPALPGVDGHRPRAALAVSDDGGTVALGGQLYNGRHFDVITVIDGCGTDGTVPVGQAIACPSRDLRGLFADGSLPDGWPVGLGFNPRGSRLDFTVEGYDGRSTRWSAYPYGDVPFTLRYLALGDSFSSGEGDTGRDAAGHSYYAAGTDDTASGGTCHLSSRSYPYVLAAHGGLERFGGGLSLPMRSVACSGARIDDIAGQGGYVGEAGRLANKSAAELAALRSDALINFLPGRLRQVDLVDEYQPAAVTLTVGGNDVQFSQVIAACVYSPVTCDYASDPVDRRNLGESIGALYPRLSALYTGLARADPGVRIHAVGYPRFINAEAAACPATVNLDRVERQMIDEGVRYMNAVIKAAAASAGIAYADVEDALAGYRACDDPGGYVNVISLLGGQRRVETFHPNAPGQTALALAIERAAGTADLASDGYCVSGSYPCPRQADPPRLPAFFGDPTSRPLLIAVPSELVRAADAALTPALVRGTEVIVQASLLAAGSTVTMEFHSEPIDVGTTTVNSDGTVMIRLTVPSTIPAGYHTLHLYATSPSGEKLDLYQVVYVTDTAFEELTTTPPASDEPTAASPIVKDPPGETSVVPDPEPGDMMPAACKTASLISQLPFTAGMAVTWLPGALLMGTAVLMLTARRLWLRPAP